MMDQFLGLCKELELHTFPNDQDQVISMYFFTLQEVVCMVNNISSMSPVLLCSAISDQSWWWIVEDCS
jgi:hypothetical protein